MKKSIMFLALALALSTNAMASNYKPLKIYDPLCVAISKNDNDTAKKIIEYGADVNQRFNGMTPLMYAARYNNVEMIKMLLDKGANPSEKDSKGISALKYAEMSNAKEALQLLNEVKK
jgi:ankyrin repeat protein